MPNNYTVDVEFTLQHTSNVSSDNQELAEEEVLSEFKNILKDNYIKEEELECINDSNFKVNSYCDDEFEWQEELAFDTNDNTQRDRSNGDFVEPDWHYEKDSVFFNFYNNDSVVFSVYCVAQASNKE